ncbi:MAG TPA: hypothetical protein VFQ68_36460 [Streptosporangiaceae bacterium]|nr:hypothetical protein [Streptosporangiaceae bacterium]
MTVNDWPEREWTLGLRRQLASDADGGPGDDGTAEYGTVEYGTVEYELICCDCGDNPRLGYREVSAGLQEVRGPYQLKAGIEAFLEHDQSHEPAF